MKRKKITSIELIILLIMVLGVIYSLIDSNVLDNKIYLTLVIILPFTLALMLEILKTNEDPKEEKEEVNKEEIEEIKKETEKKIEKTKKDDETIQIPINEIKKEIENINKKLTKEEDDEIEKTKVLFEKGELKGLIEKELESSKKKKSTKTVEKSNKKTTKSTKGVEKTKPKSTKSTKTVDK